MKQIMLLIWWLGFCVFAVPANAQISDNAPDDTARMEQAVALARAAEARDAPPVEQAQLWLEAAHTALNGREFFGSAHRRAARRHVDRAEDILEEAGIESPLLQGRVAMARANDWRWRERYSRAHEFARRGVEQLTQGGADARERADALYALGYVAYRDDDLPGSAEHFADALVLYQDLLPVLHGRRLRANGWATMTAAISERMAAQDRQLFIIAAHAPPADSMLAQIHGGDWSQTDPPGFDVTAWHGRIDGFAVFMVDVDALGVPTNIRFLQTHPGDLWNQEIIDGMTSWRLSPEALADPNARKTDIVLTFVYGVTRYQR